MSRPAADGSVTFWQQDDHRWRWRWTEAPPSEVSPGSPPDAGSLVSHQAFDSLQDAQESAATSFPDAALVLEERQREPATRHHRGRVLLAAGLVFVVLVPLRHRLRHRPRTRP